MSAPQRAAALSLLSAALSRRGYEKVQEIMDGDESLRTNERSATMFGKDLFYFSILGTPSEKILSTFPAIPTVVDGLQISQGLGKVAGKMRF